MAHIVNLFPVFGLCPQSLRHFPVRVQQRLMTILNRHSACSQTLFLEGKDLSVDN